MVAINLAESAYKRCMNDIIISDRLAGYEELSERIKKEDIFNEVYVIKLSKICPQFDKTIALKNLIINPFGILKEKYNAFLFANLNYDVSCIYRRLKKVNQNIKIYMFEDGLASYSAYYNNMLKKYQAKTGKLLKRPIHFILNNAFRHIDGLFVFEPSFMTYTTSFPVIKMKNINGKNKNLVNLYNRVFDYNVEVDSYDKKVIFFEESYYADGYDVNDIEEVEKIAAIVGKENIFIKIHPRNPQNRFDELGYTTNKNISIPWEVICMNMDLKDKILVTIASVAVIEPATMLSKEYNGILLMKMISDDTCLKKDITSLYEKICKKYTYLHLVESISELEECLN